MTEFFFDSNVIAILALFISFLSIIVGAFTLWIQHRHNRLSVRPICVISLADYENRITIKIKNAGMGSMIIKSILTSDNHGTKKEYPIDWMPVGITWAGFRRGLKKHAIKEGGEIILLEYIPKEKSDLNKTQIRSTLQDLTITVTYEDIYGVEQPIESRKLEWFGRNLPKNNATNSNS